eukprot:5001975-Amphidinium_carterae.2
MDCLQATFRRGIPLDHIQSALLLLQRKPREHLEIWMNLFEKELVIERVSQGVQQLKSRCLEATS